MRVGIDLDGTCYDFYARFRAWAEHRLGRPLHDASSSWHFYKQWSITDWQFAVMLREGCAQGWLYWSGDMIDGANDAIHAIREDGHQIVLVTSRGDYAREATESWLAQHGIEADEVVFDHVKTRHGLDVLIDDYASNVLAMQSARGSYSAVVFDQPWNQHCPALRIGSWAEAPAMVRWLAEVLDR